MLDQRDGEDDLSPLDLKAFCGECGREFEITDDTPFGVSRDEKTPAALCSPACVAANVNRILQPRCSCGAAVVAGDSLSTAGLVVGCPACNYTGAAPVVFRHYWCHGSPAALCGPLDPTKPLALTTSLAAVDCAACLSIMLKAATSTPARIRRVPMCPDCQTDPERRWATSELDGPAPCVRCGKLTVGRTRPLIATSNAASVTP